MTMTNHWSSQELNLFAATDDLFVAPFRDDGTTPGTPTRIWSVVVNNELYIRPATGPASSWYVAATTQTAGQITVAGATHDVTFDSANSAVYDAVDAAYTRKYRTDPTSVAVMVGPGPRTATVRVAPR